MLCRSLALTLVVLTFASAGPIPDEGVAVELALTVPDQETGVKVAQWAKESNVNPEELGNYLEGDIMVSESTILNGAKNKGLRWPNGVIPYVIKGNFSKYHREWKLRHSVYSLSIKTNCYAICKGSNLCINEYNSIRRHYFIKVE